MSCLEDSHFMKAAIALGERGRLTAPPNPWVGCVIVKEDRIIAEGYHHAAGQAHAEINALAQVGGDAKDATLYCTLEPCSHFGKTAPCVNAIIKAGIKKVVIPFLDPDDRVSGSGMEMLLAHGIEVIVGVCQELAKKSLQPYLTQRKTGKPYCVLKSAASLDGRIAAMNGTSQWITGEEARQDVHRLRAQSQAILIGSNTAIKDNPQLTVRSLSEPFSNPLRVVLDGTGQLLPKGQLFDLSQANTLIFTSEQCPENRICEWQASGVEVIVVDTIHGKLNLHSVLTHLGKKNIMQLLVEGGAAIHSSFLKNDLWDEYILYQGACILGHQGIPLITSLMPNDIKDAPRWKINNVERFNNDVKISYQRL